MTDTVQQTDLIEQLQQFGLKTYEARCFVALSRVPQATARELSEITDVPRTRVYDAVGVLESEGLVTIHHGNPQVFRAVDLDEAITTLRRTYETRLASIHQRLESIEPATLEDQQPIDHEVWSLSGSEAISARTERLVETADHEVRLLVDESVLDAELTATINAAANRELQLTVGVVGTHELTTELPDESLVEPSPTAFSRLGFDPTAHSTGESSAGQSGAWDSETTLTRLAVIDGEKAIVGSDTASSTDEVDERSVYAAGETNGVVVMARELLRSQLSTG